MILKFLSHRYQISTTVRHILKYILIQYVVTAQRHREYYDFKGVVCSPKESSFARHTQE